MSDETEVVAAAPVEQEPLMVDTDYVADGTSVITQSVGINNQATNVDTVGQDLVEYVQEYKTIVEQNHTDLDKAVTAALQEKFNGYVQVHGSPIAFPTASGILFAQALIYGRYSAPTK